MGLLDPVKKDIELVRVISVLEKKMVQNKDNKSMVNMILSYYISLCPKSKK